MESRLSAIEHRAGTGPEVSDLDQQIDQARRDREAAVDAQDYENAAALRDRERQLAGEKASCQQEWSAAQMNLPALAEEVRRLSGEIGYLRGLLRLPETGPQDGAA